MNPLPSLRARFRPHFPSIVSQSIAAEDVSDGTISPQSIAAEDVSEGTISVRLFRLKRMDYPNMTGPCDYTIKLKYDHGVSNTAQNETRAKASELGSDCVIQQQLFTEQYSDRKLVCEVKKGDQVSQQQPFTEQCSDRKLMCEVKKGDRVSNRRVKWMNIQHGVGVTMMLELRLV